MTRVDFYVIPSADPSARLQVAGPRGGAAGAPGRAGYRHI
ncbi:DNA polymerase III subunit chi, partial [Pseudomonas aeruginosa]|nr:DNA polymerase III subunit chi [Pseudomonas aeruginosa]